MTNTYDLTQLASSGAGSGYMKDRAYQIWGDPASGPLKIRRHAFMIGGPEWDGVTPVAGDIVKVLELGPYTTGGTTAGNVEYVIAGFINVITPADSTNYSGSTATLGDAGSATQYLGAFSLTAAGFTISPFTTAKLYSTAGFLELVTGTSSGAGAVVDCGVISFSIQTANTNL